MLGRISRFEWSVLHRSEPQTSTGSRQLVFWKSRFQPTLKSSRWRCRLDFEGKHAWFVWVQTMEIIRETHLDSFIFLLIIVIITIWTIPSSNSGLHFGFRWRDKIHIILYKQIVDEYLKQAHSWLSISFCFMLQKCCWHFDLIFLSSNVQGRVAIL